MFFHGHGILDRDVACLQKDMADGDGEVVDTAVILEEVTIVPIELPEFHPPNCRKRDLYYDAAVFKDLDEYVFSVSTFIRLINGNRSGSVTVALCEANPNTLA